MQGAGGLGNRLRGAVNSSGRKLASNKLKKLALDKGKRPADDPEGNEKLPALPGEPVHEEESNSDGECEPAAPSNRGGHDGEAAPLGVQINADDFSDHEDEEELLRGNHNNGNQRPDAAESATNDDGAFTFDSGEGRQDTLNNVTNRGQDAAAKARQVESPLDGVHRAAPKEPGASSAEDRVADLERTTQQQSVLISSLLRQIGNERGSTVEKGETRRGAPSEREVVERTPANQPAAARSDGQKRKRDYPTFADPGKKMELAIQVTLFRQPDDVSSMYPSDGLVLECLIGVWGTSKGPAIRAVMMYCVARAGSAKRKGNDWRAKISMAARRMFADAFGLVCEANPRLKFDYSELVCEEERTPTQVYNLEGVTPLATVPNLLPAFVVPSIHASLSRSLSATSRLFVGHVVIPSAADLMHLRGGLLRWHFSEELNRPFATALFDLIIRNAFQKGAGGAVTVVKAYHIAYTLYLVEYSVVHHKARGKRIPTDACVNADDIARYHRKVKAAIRHTLEHAPNNELPAWSEQHQGWVFGPTETVVISGSGFSDLTPVGADPDGKEKAAVKRLYEFSQLEVQKGKKKKTCSNESAATMERDVLDDVGEWEDAEDSV
ncbi:unnamed protein product [Closterium sp. NIES-65]|nr:unnamed protein product [Closterium sp. NIES-65]